MGNFAHVSVHGQCLLFLNFFIKNILTNFYIMHIITHRQTSMNRGAEMDNKKMAILFKAFCDENRLQILELLRSGERCACNILEEMHITQPTLSHHMKILCDSGIVTGRKEGKWMHYSISTVGLQKAMNCLEHFDHCSRSESEKSCCKK